MMTWNHRVIQRTVHDETFYEFHEVYYNKAGQIIGMTENPVTPLGESLKELREEAIMFLQACG